MKKTALVLSAVLMLQGGAVSVSSFSDVDEGYWGAEVIEQMKKNNVLDGYEDGTFRPENSLTRAECAKILVCIANLPSGNTLYDDVAEGEWYYDYVRDGGKYITNEKNFEPDKNITREEFAVAVSKVLGLSESETEPDFFDADKINNKGLVAAAVEKGFISGFDDGTFRGSDSLTRAQCCSMLARAFEAEKGEDEPSDKQVEWKLTKLTNTKLEDFAHNVIADEKGNIVLIEKDENEVVFGIDLPRGETKKETLLETRKFVLKQANASETAGYGDFVPMQLLYDEYTSKTLLFGCFKSYTDEAGKKSEAEKYVTLDFTIRIESYTEFEEGKVRKNDKHDPVFLAMFKDEYAAVFDGVNTIYCFDGRYGALRRGEIFNGKPADLLASFAEGNYLCFVGEDMTVRKYDMGSRAFEGEGFGAEADRCGMRNGKFWFWNDKTGEIFTLTSSGERETVYENVFLPDGSGINTDKLDSYMLVINDSKFMLYDGDSLYIMEKKRFVGSNWKKTLDKSA